MVGQAVPLDHVHPLCIGEPPRGLPEEAPRRALIARPQGDARQSAERLDKREQPHEAVLRVLDGEPAPSPMLCPS
eukprot:12158423-Alexandrium_andersonii.AAC.1